MEKKGVLYRTCQEWTLFQ
uniref:Uncharacterized protein n=1 Tax=Arundo donax TaxID=35708 RepID=A0A0A9B0X1_ARUDO